jgi:hypothetical protein
VPVLLVVENLNDVFALFGNLWDPENNGHISRRCYLLNLRSLGIPSSDQESNPGRTSWTDAHPVA